MFYDIRLSSLLQASQDLLRIGCGAVYLIPSALMNIVLEVRLLPVPLCFFGSLLRKPAGQADSLLFANVVRD